MQTLSCNAPHTGYLTHHQSTTDVQAVNNSAQDGSCHIRGINTTTTTTTTTNANANANACLPGVVVNQSIRPPMSPFQRHDMA